MKVSPYAFPAVVALAGFCWLGVRQAEIRELRGVAAMPHRAAPVSARSSLEGAPRKTVESDRARLRRWAAAFRNGGSGWLRTDLREVEELESMSREELIAALEELPDAGIDEIQRANMKARLLNLLEEMDPEYVTVHFRRSSALMRWAKEDPAGALAWFEEQVAAGTIKSGDNPDGRHERLSIERALVLALVSSDPAAAERLFLKRPEESRIELFRGQRLTDAEEHTEQIRVLRKHLPEKDRLNVLTWPLTEKSWLGETGTLEWPEVEEYLWKMEATPEERRACILAVAAAGRFAGASGDYFDTAPEDIEALRTWVAEEDPGLITEATAEALKRVAGRDDFPSWAEYAVRLHEAGEGDSVLKALLDAHPAGEHPNLARSLAERLAPGEERERYLERFNSPKP